jgi:TatD DNase family protein
VPYRGKVNSPAYVPFVAAQIAALKGVPVETVARVTSANFERLFKIPQLDESLGQ